MPNALEFRGRYYPESLRQPFEEHECRVLGVREACITLSFLWDGACLEAICQARLAGFTARGDKIKLNRPLILHKSDFCTASAVLHAGGEMTIQVVEKTLSWPKGQRDFDVLSRYEDDADWVRAFEGDLPRFGEKVRIRQLDQPVRVFGHFTTLRGPDLAINLVYPIRQTDAPHPSEVILRQKIEAVRHGKKMPYSIPRMALGVIFARDIVSAVD